MTRVISVCIAATMRSYIILTCTVPRKPFLGAWKPGFGLGTAAHCSAFVQVLFNLPDRGEILIELFFVRFRNLALQAAALITKGIHDATLFADHLPALFQGDLAVTEEGMK